jgi:hypothetical protein
MRAQDELSTPIGARCFYGRTSFSTKTLAGGGGGDGNFSSSCLSIQPLRKLGAHNEVKVVVVPSIQLYPIISASSRRDRLTGETSPADQE